MLDHSSPALLELVRDVRESAEGEPRTGRAHVLVDWLQDQGAETGDVCHLYGSPPPWVRHRWPDGKPEMPDEMRQHLEEEDGYSTEHEWVCKGIVVLPPDCQFLALECMCGLGREAYTANPRAIVAPPNSHRIFCEQRRCLIGDRLSQELTFLVGQCPGCRRVCWAVPDWADREEVPPAEDDSLRPVLALWCGAVLGDAALMDRVKALHIESNGYDTWWIVPEAERWLNHHSAAEASRELKRRVLRLFPDVRLRRSFTLPYPRSRRESRSIVQAIEERIRELSWDAHERQVYPKGEHVETHVEHDTNARTITCTQTLPPWLLIPPETASVGFERNLDLFNLAEIGVPVSASEVRRAAGLPEPVE